MTDKTSKFFDPVATEWYKNNLDKMISLHSEFNYESWSTSTNEVSSDLRDYRCSPRKRVKLLNSHIGISNDTEIASYVSPLQKLPQTLQNEISVQSPAFFNTESSEVEWCLILKYTTEGNKTSISLYLQCINHNYIFCSPMLRVTFSLIYPYQKKIITRSKIIFDLHRKHLYGFKSFDVANSAGFQDSATDNFNYFQLKCKIEKVHEDFENCKYFLNDPFNDVWTFFNGKLYATHTFILAASSLHFRRIIGCPEFESGIKKVTMNGIEFHVFYALMNYMYKGEVNLSKEHYEDAIKYFEAAAKYKILSLMRKCKKFMVANLCLNNVVPTILAGKIKFETEDSIPIYSEILDELINQSANFIVSHLEAIMKLDLCQKLLKEPKFLVEIFIRLCSDLPPWNSKYKLITGSECCYCNKDRKFFARFVNSEEFSDLEIRVGKETFFAHKVFLVSKSPVFNVMFSHEMKEAITGILIIEDTSPEVFQEVLRFIYTGEFDGKGDLLKDIFIVADKYQIKDLKLKCEDLLHGELTMGNVFSILDFSVFYNAERLKKKCIEFIITKLARIRVKKDAGVDIQKDYLMNLANSNPHLMLEMLYQVYEIWMWKKNRLFTHI